MTVKIPLTHGKFAYVDDADADLVCDFVWRAKQDGATWYACRTVWRPDDSCTTEYMHKLITGWPQTDHRDGNGLDNRRANLRLASDEENQRNQRKTHGTSRYKGVCYFRATGRWHAQLRLGDKTIHLGFFFVEEDAARAYDAEARRRFGEFAALNFPRQGERSALVGDERPQDDSDALANATLRVPQKWRQGSARKKKQGSSKYKGVYLDRLRNKWIAQIRHRHIGAFDLEEDAARAYDAAAREAFGNRAALNFPQGGERSALVDQSLHWGALWWSALLVVVLSG